MKLLRCILVMLMTCLSLVAALPAQIASATSAYDDNYTTVDSLFYGDVNYYGINCPIQDVTETYLDIFSNPDYWVYSGEYSTYWSSFQDALDEGSWAVSVQQHRMSTGYDANINLFWNPEGGTIDFDGSQVIPGGVGTVKAQLYMRQDLLGSGGCVPAIRAMTSNGPLSASPGVDVSTTTNGFYHSNFVAANWDVTYPSGYEGEFIRTVAPAPVTTPYTGTVDCGGEDPLLMNIYQVGNNGAATLAPESLGRADWSYDLTAGGYSITVDCGGTLASSYAPVYPTTGTDWVCDVYGEGPHYCVLS